MRKLILFVLSGVLLTACHPEEKAIRQMCEQLHTQYPAATLQDVYKTCYQDFFGAEHLVRDTAAARMYLYQELDECRKTDLSRMPAQEATGFRHRFIRVNLSNVVNGEITEEQLLTLFLDAAGSENTLGENWSEEWDRICRIALQVCPEWADTVLQAELQEAAQANAAVRHSDLFRSTYHPHYRIVRAK